MRMEMMTYEKYKKDDPIMKKLKCKEKVKPTEAIVTNYDFLNDLTLDALRDALMIEVLKALWTLDGVTSVYSDELYAIGAGIDEEPLYMINVYDNASLLSEFLLNNNQDQFLDFIGNGTLETAEEDSVQLSIFNL